MILVGGQARHQVHVPPLHQPDYEDPTVPDFLNGPHQEVNTICPSHSGHPMGAQHLVATMGQPFLNLTNKQFETGALDSILAQLCTLVQGMSFVGSKPQTAQIPPWEQHMVLLSRVWSLNLFGLGAMALDVSHSPTALSDCAETTTFCCMADGHSQSPILMRQHLKRRLPTVLSQSVTKHNQSALVNAPAQQS